MRERFVRAALALALLPVAARAELPADCSAAKPPSKSVEASVAGTQYAPSSIKLAAGGSMKMGDTEIEMWRLALRSEDSVFAPLSVTVTVAVPKGQSIEGKVFRKLPVKSTMDQPSVAKGLPEVQGWSYEDRKAGARGSHVKYLASLRLEFGKAEGKTLPGRIYLCVPKGQKSSFDKAPVAADSYAIGSFSAALP